MKIEFDTEEHTFVVGGVKFDLEYIGNIAHCPIGTVFEVVARENGSVTLKTISTPAASAEKVETFK